MITFLLLLIGCPPGDKAADTAGGDSGGGVDSACAAVIEVSPMAIDFGYVDVGDELIEVVTLTNMGCGALQLSDIQGSGAAFSISAVGSVLIPPGSSTTFTVTFAPTDATTHTGTVTIESNDPLAPAVDVALSGGGLMPVIDASPPATDLGEVGLYCEETAPITIANAGTADLVVTDLDLISASSDFTLDSNEDENGPLPWTLSPGSSLIIEVLYLPVDDYEDDAYVIITSNDPVTPEEQVHLSATGVATEVTDTFVYATEEIDVLLVVDNSCSLADQFTAIDAAWGSFVDALAATGADYQVSIIGTDGCAGGDVPWIDPSLSREDQITTLSGMYAASGSGEMGFTLLEAALDASVTGGCNEGLVRGGRLELVGVTDEAEQSPDPWSDYVATFETFVADADDLTVHAVAGDYPSGCGDVEAGLGWYEASAATDGAFLSVCTGDWDATWANVADAVGAGAGVPDSFELGGWPAEESIIVLVDGVETTDWTYASTDNALTIDPPPPDPSTVTITYSLETCAE